MKKFFVIFILGIFIFSSISFAGTPSPEGQNYIGEGYDSLRESYLVNSCLTYPQGCSETVAECYSGSGYTMVDTKEELREKIEGTVMGNIGLNLGYFNGSSEVTRKIINQTEMNENTVTIAYDWQEVVKRIYINGAPLITAEALSLTTNTFQSIYGDKYVNEVQLGRKFYMIYQALNFSLNSSSISKEKIKWALDVKLNKLTGTADVETEAEATEILSESSAEVNCYCYGCGVDVPTSINTNEEYLSLVKTVESSTPVVIGKYLKFYNSTSNGNGRSYLELKNYVSMRSKWQIHLENINYIEAKTISPYLYSLCESAKSRVNLELDRVINTHELARFPNPDEFNNVYLNYIRELNIQQESGWFQRNVTQWTIEADRKSIYADIDFYPDYVATLTAYVAPISMRDPCDIDLYCKSSSWTILGSYQNLVYFPFFASSGTIILHDGPVKATKFRIISTWNTALPAGTNLNSLVKAYFKFTKKLKDPVWNYLKANGYI